MHAKCHSGGADGTINFKFSSLDHHTKTAAAKNDILAAIKCIKRNYHEEKFVLYLNYVYKTNLLRGINA